LLKSGVHRPDQDDWFRENEINGSAVTPFNVDLHDEVFLALRA